MRQLGYQYYVGISAVAQLHKAWSLPLTSGEFTSDIVGNFSANSTTPQFSLTREFNTTSPANLTTVQGFSTGLQVTEGMVSLASITLVAATYWILTAHATHFSTTSKIPFSPLKENICRILSLTWPKDESSDSELLSREIPREKSLGEETPHEKPPSQKKNKIRLLYVGQMTSEGAHRQAKGVTKCRATPLKHIEEHAFWINSGSQATKSVVRLATWEWITLWLALGMVLNTLSFNGFFTRSTRHDSKARLAVVLVYFGSYLGHSYYVGHQFFRFMTLDAAASAWSMLNRANFSVVDRNQLHQYNKRPGKGGQSPESPAAALNLNIQSSLRDEVEYALSSLRADDLNTWTWRHALQVVRTCYRSTRGQVERDTIQPLLDLLGVGELELESLDQADAIQFFQEHVDVADARERAAEPLPAKGPQHDGVLVFHRIERDTVPADYKRRAFTACVLPGRTIPAKPDLGEEQDQDLQSSIRTVYLLQEEQKKEGRDAASKALELIITNAVVMMGINISTTFSTLTAPTLTDNTSTQIGSLALLTTIVAGLTSLVKSSSHLSEMNDCFFQTLNCRETIINGYTIEFIQKRRLRDRVIGFADSKVTASPVTWCQLVHGMNWYSFVPVLIFGPAYNLLPSRKDARQRSTDVDFELNMDIADHTITFTTETTDRHNKREEDNLEAVNVCSQPKLGREPAAPEPEPPTSPAPSVQKKRAQDPWYWGFSIPR